MFACLCSTLDMRLHLLPRHTPTLRRASCVGLVSWNSPKPDRPTDQLACSSTPLLAQGAVHENQQVYRLVGQ